MALELASVGRMKEQFERMNARVANIKKANEKTIKTAGAIAFVNGTAAVAGYANERWGSAAAADPNGFRELRVLGAPVDLLGGFAMLGLSLVGGFGKYDEFGLNVGNGALSAFSYRFGAEFARRHAA